MIDIARLNFFEAIVWFAVSVVFLLCGIYGKRIFSGQRKIFYFLSAILALFGISDLIEMKIGTWFGSPYLLLLKGCCVIGIVFGIGTIYQKAKKVK